MRAVSGLAVALAMALAVAARADPARPAERPPADYRGQQYVDSKGCLFRRAGPPGNQLWLPRVTRQGVTLCANPPSGRRVKVVEEGAAETSPGPGTDGAAGGGALTAVLVAVASLGQAPNAARAEARLAALKNRLARGRQADGGVTV